jgi:hypothetical protein
MRMLIVALGVVSLVLAAAPAAFAPYHIRPTQAAPSPVERARSQLTTAKTHAGFAASAGSLGGVHLHAGHAVNCLVAADDKRFDKQWGNVCEGQGSGALVDLKAAGARGADAMKIAEEAARAGAEALSKTDLGAAQAGARKLAGLVDDALKALK